MSSTDFVLLTSLVVPMLYYSPHGLTQWRTPIQGEIRIADDKLESRKAPNTHLGYDEKVDAVIGGGAWRAGPPPSIHRLMDTDPRTGLHSMWRTGGGRKTGYEELRAETAGDRRGPASASAPVWIPIRTLRCCDEIEDSKGKGVVDTAGQRIACDAEETACLRQRGVSVT